MSQCRDLRSLVSHGVVSGCELASSLRAGTGPSLKLGKLLCGGLNYVPPKLTCGSLNHQRDGD